MAITSAALTAAGTGVAAVGQYGAMKGQAKADQQRANIEAAWAQRKAAEERAGAQRGAFEEQRKARLAQSRLTAVAGGSGSGSDDQTVMDLWGDISKEGQYNAEAVTAAGEQRATGLEYQGDLGRWTADANARIKNAGARTTLIGGLLSAGGQFGSGYSGSRMAARYGSGAPTGRTGYG
jgi:hypothetical protein